jgi:hypothetical protein
MCQFAIEFDKTNNPIPFNLNELTNKNSKTTILGDALLCRIKERLMKYSFENGEPIKLITPFKINTIKDDPTQKPSKELTISHLSTDNTFVKTAPILPINFFPESDDGDLLSLRHNYLHWSSNYDRVSLRIIPNYPRIIDNQGNIKRRILKG